MIYFKRSIFVALVAILSIIVITGPTTHATTNFQVNASAHGFTISDDYISARSSDYYEKEVIVHRQDKFEHYTKIIEYYLVNTVDSTLKGYAYKVITDPQQPGRHWGFMGIGSYGDDFLQDSVKVTIQFPINYTIMNYAPTNSPATTTTTIGVSAGSSGLNISANVSFNHSELTVKSNTSTGSRRYETIYDFNQNNWTDYTTGEVASFGMLIFKREGETSYGVTFDIRYHDWNGGEQGLEQVYYESGC